VFTYKSNKLTSQAAAVAPGTKPVALSLPELKIERIVILGLPKKGAYKVKLPGGKVGLQRCCEGAGCFAALGTRYEQHHHVAITAG
jgi:hypothetical protein